MHFQKIRIVSSLDFKLGWIDARTFTEPLREELDETWYAMPNCLYRFGRGEKLEGINLHCN